MADTSNHHEGRQWDDRSHDAAHITKWNWSTTTPEKQKKWRGDENQSG
jgi:hypothetical protein